jgi:hypothetical protein
MGVEFLSEFQKPSLVVSQSSEGCVRDAPPPNGSAV